MTQASQHAKFRWTEKLTCRFIQLRKDNQKLFTGRKYSAQAGWEYILQQMREEFPAAMATVQYRVLKKKWSNLLQQYKELKNPVHGNRNKPDDAVSWPFYNAIDEIVGGDRGETPINDFIDPHEFLCVSVTPEEPTSSSADAFPLRFHPETESRTCNSLPDCLKIKKPRPPPLPLNTRQRGKSSTRRRSFPRLPRATEVIIEEVTSADSEYLRKVCRQESEIRPRKSRRRTREDRGSRTDRCIEEIFEYIKRRDEENRSIIVRLMHAVEAIAGKLNISER